MGNMGTVCRGLSWSRGAFASMSRVSRISHRLATPDHIGPGSTLGDQMGSGSI